MPEHKGSPNQRLEAHKEKADLKQGSYIFPTQGGFAVFTVDIRHGV